MSTLSLIIPTYNEERHIRKCLEAVAAQTVMPDEVIVVDNNCSDRTVEIARSYDFVTIIKESKQGRGYARSAGFNAATGALLGRIDADSRLDVNWVEVAKKSFEQDADLAGITGMAKTAFLPGINFLKSTLFTRVYYWFAHSNFDTITMWGANTVIRRSAWDEVRDKVLDDHLEIHEDQDISLWIAAAGGKIAQNNKLKISTNGQGFRYLPKMIRYSLMFERTLKIHKENGNMESAKLCHLGFWQTLPGRLGAVFMMIVTAPILVLFLPIDFLVSKIWPKSWWLD